MFQFHLKNSKKCLRTRSGVYCLSASALQDAHPELVGRHILRHAAVSGHRQPIRHRRSDCHVAEGRVRRLGSSILETQRGARPARLSRLCPLRIAQHFSGNFFNN